MPLGDVTAVSMQDTRTRGGEDGREGHTDRRVGEGTDGSCDRTWGGGVREEKWRTIFRFAVTGA